MSVAARRLISEYKQLSRNPPEGIIAGPVDESNLFEWEAIIVGPNDTPYQGGIFKARLTYPTNYPHSPPVMRFVSKMYHPNVFSNGEVCISILHPPGDDPLFYEDRDERWSPIQSTEKILLSVASLFAEPNCESPANVEAAKIYRENRQLFNELVRNCVQESLNRTRD